MKLSDKIRFLREVEGSLRGLGRALTQQELVKLLAEESADGKGISQSYLSQIESGARPHLTNTTRLLLARFFKVHPGYLVEDPEDFHAELRTPVLASAEAEEKLDLWLIAGADRFGRTDPALCRALLTLAHQEDTRGALLLLESILKTPRLPERLAEALRPASLPATLDAAADHPPPPNPGKKSNKAKKSLEAPKKPDRKKLDRRKNESKS